MQIRLFVLAVILFACSVEAAFRYEWRKSDGIRKSVENFPIPRVDFAADPKKRESMPNTSNSKLQSTSPHLLEKIRNALLLRGTPMGILQPQQMLPLPGLPTSGEHPASASNQPLTLKDYNIVNCSKFAAEKATFVVKQLNLSPDPLTLPGTINIGFDVSILSEMDNIIVTVDARIKLGDKTFKLPCIEGIGSCTYNVCDLLSQVTTCPQELLDHHITCRCPFQKGDYKEPGIAADIEGGFVAGTYNVTVSMTASDRFASCYTATFTLA